MASLARSASNFPAFFFSSSAVNPKPRGLFGVWAFAEWDMLEKSNAMDATATAATNQPVTSDAHKPNKKRREIRFLITTSYNAFRIVYISRNPIGREHNLLSLSRDAQFPKVINSIMEYVRVDYI